MTQLLLSIIIMSMYTHLFHCMQTHDTSNDSLMITACESIISMSFSVNNIITTTLTSTGVIELEVGNFVSQLS